MLGKVLRIVRLTPLLAVLCASGKLMSETRMKDETKGEGDERSVLKREESERRMHPVVSSREKL